VLRELKTRTEPAKEIAAKDTDMFSNADAEGMVVAERSEVNPRPAVNITTKKEARWSTETKAFVACREVYDTGHEKAIEVSRRMSCCETDAN
jgi:hypothetical protein